MMDSFRLRKHIIMIVISHKLFLGLAVKTIIKINKNKNARANEDAAERSQTTTLGLII